MPPIGGGEGPSPGMLLQTAIANCLASSLLFWGKRGCHVRPALWITATMLLLLAARLVWYGSPLLV